MTHISPIKQRIRIIFGKFDALKYTGNLDLAKIWERVLRRARLPILYTQGFNTRPRIQLASALPLGITSECEILDVALKESVPLDGLAEHLLSVSPKGLRIYTIHEVETTGPALQTLVRSAEYRIRFEDSIDPTHMQAQIDRVLTSGEILKTSERKGKTKTVDLRPLILDLTVESSGDLIAHLAVGGRGNIRPDAVLEEMEWDTFHHTIHRFRLHLDTPEADGE
jgi:radical SAM-linked protein